jgi:tetratricopeptide (TPR) repeat protein
VSIEILLSEAERYLTRKDVDRAAELFWRAQELCGGRSPLPLVGLARVALLISQPEGAAPLLDAVLLKFPRCAEALTMKGVVEEFAGNLEQANALHGQALAIDPTLSTAHVNQARTWAQLERWELAAASYQLAIQHGGPSADVQVQLGTALFRAKRTTEALKVLALTVQSHPKHLDAILTLADCLVETAALGLAAELLDNAAHRLPDEALIASRRASIALRMKDLEAAHREAWRTTTLAPRDEEAWLFAAVIDTMRLRFDTAEKALKHVVRLNPKNWRAHYHLGGLYDALKDKREAKKEYRAAIECDRGAWEPLNNLSIMLLEEGTPEAVSEARALLDRAARLGMRGDTILVRYNLALACFKLGDFAGARRAAQELLKLAPADHPMVNEAHRVLKVAA